MSEIKKPRLFYYEDAEDAWVPIGDNYDIESIVSLENFSEDGETIEIIFKRTDMTDEEFNNIPEE